MDKEKQPVKFKAIWNQADDSTYANEPEVGNEPDGNIRSRQQEPPRQPPIQHLRCGRSGPNANRRQNNSSNTTASQQQRNDSRNRNSRGMSSANSQEMSCRGRTRGLANLPRRRGLGRYNDANNSHSGNIASNQGNARNANRPQRNDVRNRTRVSHFPERQISGASEECGELLQRREKRDVKPIMFRQAEILSTQRPNEILLTLVDDSNGFEAFLKQENKNRNVMAYLIIALEKAVTSYMKNNVNALIMKVISHRDFLIVHIPLYLASFIREESEEYHKNSLNSLAGFLKKFQSIVPSNASDVLAVVLPALEKTCQRFSDHDTQFTTVLKALKEMEERNDDHLKKYSAKETQKASKGEQLHLQQPPENYRMIPVLPSEEDIHQMRPFLRPNIVKGSYSDTEHYLDVQFRLLREDYIRPLREGIAEYLQLSKSGKSLKHLRDVRLYTDVRMIKQDFAHGGLVHIAHFNDKKFTQIKWEFSKRFLSGSLLCLSSDGFQTMLFASVAKREPKELANGLLMLRFEELTDEVLSLNPERTFVVIETNAYFEAYRYNLNALHDLNEEVLPMKSYIIQVEKNVKNPHYIRYNTTYDMRPLLLPFNGTHIEHNLGIDGKYKTTYKFPASVDHRARNVLIAEDNSWPTCTDFNLDPSQYAALKAAITKEFAVIQGPPGTGKTYIGLRITQLLLHNITQWKPPDRLSPILIVCYTNHALDQFLEGLLVFTRNIVRVGGRSSNEALSIYQLNNLKRVMQDKRQVPNVVFKNIRRKNFDLNVLKRNLNDVQNSIAKLYTNVQSELRLRDYMDEKHYMQLKKPFEKNQDDGSVLLDWLGTRVRDFTEGAQMHQSEGYMSAFARDADADDEMLRNFIGNTLNVQPMNVTEVKDVQNIWLLHAFDRRRLYKFWLQSFLRHKQHQIMIENPENGRNILMNLVDECSKSILSEYILEAIIDKRHFNSLCYISADSGIILRMSGWLEMPIEPIAVLASLQDLALQDVNVQDSQNTTTAVYDETVDSEGEADIEFIEAQRDVDSEEFADVSFDIPIFDNVQEVSMVQDGWQIQGGKKRLEKYIKNQIRNTKPMSKDEAKLVRNIWALKIPDRWRLYKHWFGLYTDAKQQEVFSLQQQMRTEFKELVEMRNEEDIFVCQQADVVGMTTTGCAKYRNLLQHLSPRIVIVEEAAEILESHIVTSLTADTQHVILIGDHQQLRPSPTVYALAANFGLDVSLFERMVNNNMECYKLGIQHRMRPEIAELLVPNIYPQLENHESVEKYEDIKGVCKNVFFVTHNFCELSENDSKSKVNEHEARFIVKLCRYILQQGYEPSQITVLTTYSGQLFQLKRLTRQNAILQGVKITVVDNYQGEENDIILISFVRSNESGEIGFLKVSNRVCVALSRAKKGLFCIGNFELLQGKSDLWKGIVSTLQKSDRIRPSLQLVCQNHPDVSNVVACDKDFESVPEGGCTRSCEFRLQCGHVCSMMCHPYDPGHENVQCTKPCVKECDYGHPCPKKCSAKCGVCKVLVEKTLDVCGHVIKVPCFSRLEKVNCTAQCSRDLPCGHVCKNICSKNCTVICRERVQVLSPVCGHEIKCECFHSHDENFLFENCNKPCSAVLSCDHVCKGTCSSCRQKRLHKVCNQRCKRILVCGHECLSPCSKSCPPCKRPCENRCVHSKCPKKCGEPCDQCKEPCSWECVHLKCSRKCGNICDREPCAQPCEKLLKCKHKCIGFCGEPCPTVCRFCDKDIVEEIFFGTEDEPNAQFVCLEDCNHFFEGDKLSEWMKLSNEDSREIQMKTCPKCKTVVRKNMRFGNVVKICLREIEKVKKVTFGDKKSNSKKLKELQLKMSNQNANVQELCPPLLDVLKSSKHRSIQEITIMENIINISIMMIDIDTVSLTYVPSYVDVQIKHYVNEVFCFLKETRMFIKNFIQDEYLTASEQQLHEIAWEIHRLKLINTFLKIVLNRPDIKLNDYFKPIVKILLRRGPFREKEAESFSVEFKRFTKMLCGAIINVSELEKTSILKAMGLSRGHWYQCPNGHVYCITECGGAMEVGKCNECGAEIGGSNHSLISNNRVASAMDGARAGAWSEAMNMENYNF